MLNPKSLEQPTSAYGTTMKIKAELRKLAAKVRSIHPKSKKKKPNAE